MKCIIGEKKQEVKYVLNEVMQLVKVEHEKFLSRRRASLKR